MKIHRKELSVTGSWLVLAEIDETESIFLKWGKEEPDIEDQKVIDWAQEHVSRIVDDRQQMQALATTEPTVDELKAQLEAQAKVIEEKNAIILTKEDSIKSLEATVTAKEAELSSIKDVKVEDPIKEG